MTTYRISNTLAPNGKYFELIEKEDGECFCKDTFIFGKIIDKNKQNLTILWKHIQPYIYAKYIINDNNLIKFSETNLNTNIKNYFLDNQNYSNFTTNKPIDIVIPVYNGYEYLKPLFNSIYTNTLNPFRLLVANDHSTDKKVLPYLKSIANKHKNFILIENQENLGFVKTVNRLVELTENHFVLLNTDTEVPKNWIERLMYPIFKMKNIATTTPFTNSGTICSFPEHNEDNLLPHGLNVNQVDEYFRRVSFDKTYIEIPTGVGFCMGVNRDVVEKIGMFDTVFGKGYGEDNDFCQRAIKFGYKNIHVSNLYVYHKHSGSFFTKIKSKLIQQNLKLVNSKYPNYEYDVNKTIVENKLNTLRKIINFKIQSRDKKVILFFDHGLGGGASNYLQDQIKKLMQQNALSVVIEHDFDNHKFNLILHFPDSMYRIPSKSIDNLIKFILDELNINEIFVNSIVGYDQVDSIIQDILKYKNKQKLTVPIHDYYPICPSYTLLNDQGVYCGVPQDLSVCHKCLRNNNREFKKFTSNLDITSWRNSWNRLLQSSDEILAFSQSSIDILLKTFNGLEKKIKLIPHNISGRFDKIYNSNETKNNKELVIGVLGGINEAKGIYVLKDLAEHIEKNNLNARIVVFGDTSIQIDSSVFKKTGKYNITNLPNIIKKENISLFFIPSIWPETYSYVADEIMQMGYPLVVFDLGAPAERVLSYELGRVIDIADSKNMNNLFFHLNQIVCNQKK